MQEIKRSKGNHHENESPEYYMYELLEILESDWHIFKETDEDDDLIDIARDRYEKGKAFYEYLCKNSIRILPVI